MVSQTCIQASGAEGTAHIGIGAALEVKTSQFANLQPDALFQEQDQYIGAFDAQSSIQCHINPGAVGKRYQVGRFQLKMRDLAIWATVHPILSAASWEVRVEPGNSLTSKANPLAVRKSCTRWALSLSFFSI